MLRNFTLGLILLATAGCNNAGKAPEKAVQETLLVAATAKPEKYSSITCQTGDISLLLKPDWTFDLTILFWDSKTRKHTGKESIEGGWVKTDSVLTLSSADNTIKYKLGKTPMQIGTVVLNATTYKFIENSHPFFGTGFDLLDTEETDTVFLEQAKISTSANDSGSFHQIKGRLGS